MERDENSVVNIISKVMSRPCFLAVEFPAQFRSALATPLSACPPVRLCACALVQSVTFGAADWQAAGTRATANNQRHSRHTDTDRQTNENSKRPLARCPIRLVSRSSFRLAKPHNTDTFSLSLFLLSIWPRLLSVLPF